MPMSVNLYSSVQGSAEDRDQMIYLTLSLPIQLRLYQGVKYSIEASSSINTGVETTRSHLAD